MTFFAGFPVVARYVRKPPVVHGLERVCELGIAQPATIPVISRKGRPLIGRVHVNEILFCGLRDHLAEIYCGKRGSSGKQRVNTEYLALHKYGTHARPPIVRALIEQALSTVPHRAFYYARQQLKQMMRPVFSIEFVADAEEEGPFVQVLFRPQSLVVFA